MFGKLDILIFYPYIINILKCILIKSGIIKDKENIHLTPVEYKEIDIVSSLSSQFFPSLIIIINSIIYTWVLGTY